MSTGRKRTFDVSGLAVLALLFLAVIMVSNLALRGVRADLTEARLYTISEGTKNILENIAEPVNLYFFFSDRESGNLPTIRDYARRVRELLEEFEEHAGGKLNLEVIDPVPFSEEEDMAASFGLQSVPVGAAGETLYFGLVGTNAVDDAALIPFFQPDKQQFLEYDVAKLVYTLADPQRPVIGIMTELPMLADFDPMTQRIRDPWIIAEQVQGLFELRRIPTTTTAIEDDVDVAMIVHPKELGEPTLYAIDQFVLRGGRAVIFVDPQAELDSGPNPNDPMQAMPTGRSSNLERLFDAWGVAYSPSQVVADARLALAVNLGRGGPPVRHLAMLGLTGEALNPDDVVSGGLSQINVATAGYFRSADGATIELEPLLVSSAEAAPIGTDRLRFMEDPETLLADFSPTGETYAIAARLSGTVSTAFPDGPPAAADEESAAASEPRSGDHLTEAPEPVNVILVADTDLLSDRLWVRVDRFFGQRIASAWASNGDFVVNALDNLTGNSDLISIRGRAVYSRPFLRVQELERQADERWRGKIRELEAQLEQTEQRLGELQADRSDENLAILTPEQSAEIASFQEQRLKVRKELREVRLTLNQDKERLGAWLKALNIGVMPVLLTLCLAVFARLVGRRSGR